MIKGGVPQEIEIRGKRYKSYDLDKSLWKRGRGRGTVYKIIFFRRFNLTHNGEPAVVFTRADGKDKIKWVMAWDEFFDGRFQRVLKGEGEDYEGEDAQDEMFWDDD